MENGFAANKPSVSSRRNAPKDRVGVSSGQITRLLAYTIVIIAAFGFIYFKSNSLRSKFRAAVIESEQSNRLSITALADGSRKVSGTADGKRFEYIEDDRILQGVSIAGIDLGGMTYEQARSALLEDIEKRISGINICANVENTTLLLTAVDFNVHCDVNELLHKAFAIGREHEDQTDFYQIYLDRQKVADEGCDLGGYELTMDEESMRAKVDEIASMVDKAPVEPYVTLLNLIGGGKPGVGVGGRADDLASETTVNAPDGTAMARIQYHNGRNGYVLDREDMLNKISDAFYSGNYNLEINVELKETAPSKTVDELLDSFKEISKFSTGFASSSNYRARNVQKAAGLLHCTIMEPGEELGYNELLGPRNEKDGWLQAPGISGGKEYIDSPGGGICQVSSTLYNAFLKLGPDITIVKRYHHSIPGSYVDKGLDATVSYGGPDLVWKNATDSTMLLFTYADVRSRKVYAIVYGTPAADGCTYKVWSETVETIAPPEPKRIEEPTWPSGYSKTVISSRTGYNVDVFRQKIDAQGKAVGDAVKLYQDKYAAVQAEIHVGTGPSYLPVPQG